MNASVKNQILSLVTTFMDKVSEILDMSGHPAKYEIKITDDEKNNK